MPKTIVTEETVYSFNELSEDAQQDAIDDNREWNVDHDWWEHVYYDFNNICEILGVEIDTRPKLRIYFEGFYHQGSGSAFEGDYIYKPGAHKAIRKYAPTNNELHRIADELLTLQKANFYRLTASISQSGRYYSLSVDTQMTDHINGGSDYAPADIDESLGEIMRDLNSYLYDCLEREYEYLTSDDAIKERLIDNEIEFYEDGSIA